MTIGYAWFAPLQMAFNAYLGPRPRGWGMYVMVAPPSLTVRGVGGHIKRVMNVAAAATAFAPTTFELCLSPSFVTPASAPVPADSFVTKLVASLAGTYPLDEAELELAELLLYGRTIGAIARKLGLSTRETSRRCAALFAATCTDGRQQLFETAARLRATRELAHHLMYGGR